MSDWNRMRRGNPRTTLTTGVVLVVLVVYLLSRWDSGLLANLWQGAVGEATATVTAARATPQAAGGPSHAPTPTLAPTRPAEAAIAAPTATVRTQATASPTATPQPSPTANAPPTPVRASHLPVVNYDDLPPEAHITLALIDQGGPFPFRQDGAVFQNRERILPPKSQGYYREYTVITPDEDDRGARRIVGGQGGELYYTDDHYASFREIIR